MTTHHLESETILRLAGGSLDPVLALVARTHIGCCPDCDSALAAIEDAGGVFLDEIAPEPVSATLRERTLAALDAAPKATDAPTHRPIALQEGSVPAPLDAMIGDDLSAVRWKPIAPGVAKHDLPTPKGSRGRLFLLKIAPGKRVPEHGHGGTELTMVLSGSYSDHLGCYGPGDVADLDADLEHQPHVDPGAPCISVVASETPARFKGLIGRLLQPVLGI
ncbi:ChrR family anti-sigma-E factor [Rhodobium gokarnense]|uniref:Transcriptional regulator n=1 Tax=Rhodobium gokarnense TaxID=364296 RepID=A0ABT3HF39_9HYPH|nr:ChrR family anti-sigma-E factor [Rhodobium gokarnense]MCW2308896.1 putative transcriptional regulator [Rhodobium gokarnense]